MQVFRGRGPKNIGGKVESGPTLPKPLTDRVLPPESCVARRDVLDLSGAVKGDGRIKWAAPARCAEWTVLRIGSKGQAVRQMQRYLRSVCIMVAQLLLI